MDYALGIDIGVTNVKAVRVTPAGDVLARASFPTRADSPDWPHQIKSRLADLERAHGPAKRLGLAAPGVAHADGSHIRWMQGRLAEVQDLRWSEFLARPSPVLNDAQAALLGEAWLGAARGAANALLLTLGTGVGGAAIVDGRLLRGHLGRAGHLGHISLDIDGEKDIANTPGSLETLIGNYTIARRTSSRFHSTHDLIDAVRQHDPDAQQIWTKSLRALAAAIASLINVLDPQLVILGGGIATAGDTLFNPLRDQLREFAWSLEGEQVQIVPAQLGEYAGAIGAAKNAMNSTTGT